MSCSTKFRSDSKRLKFAIGADEQASRRGLLKSNSDKHEVSLFVKGQSNRAVGTLLDKTTAGQVTVCAIPTPVEKERQLVRSDRGSLESLQKGDRSSKTASVAGRLLAEAPHLFHVHHFNRWHSTI